MSKPLSAVLAPGPKITFLSDRLRHGTPSVGQTFHELLAEGADCVDRATLLHKALEEAMPLIMRAATEEARANKAPTGLKPRRAMRDLLERATKALKEGA